MKVVAVDAGHTPQNQPEHGSSQKGPIAEVDPLHWVSPPNERWTTRNFAEAIPEVPTALSWSIWRPGIQHSSYQVYAWLGAYSRDELRELQSSTRRVVSIFYGHVAGNVDVMSEAVARTPGGDPASFERDFFGLSPSDRTPKPTRRRWLLMLPRLVAMQLQHPKRLRQLGTDTDTWWRSIVASPPDPATARALLAEAAERFKVTMAIHALQTSLSQAAFTKVGKIAAAAGVPGAELTLATGSGVLEEAAVARDLWAVAHDTLALDTFIERHGYHGPHEGELSARSWREDQAPVVASVTALRERPDDASPEASIGRTAAARVEAMGQVLDSRSGPSRLRMRRAIDGAAKQVALREVGKAAFLKVLDVARFAARIVGEDLRARGAIERADDVFHLTLAEVLGATATEDLRSLVATRAESRLKYLDLELPANWTGNPEPVTASVATFDSDRLVGLAASPGVAVGRARVVLDPEEDTEPLDSDEILVANTTDPGWMSMFLGAGGMVVDVGGPMSHAAIVARELSVPCVINTMVGTRTIRSGDLLRVDGSAGTVEILKRAA